jgi:5-methylcytosine-specific restriction endonuclease McrA
MLKVVRRDGQICQRCHEPVRDDEVEFDHIIPFSRGGRSTADNLRLVRRDCNRRKSDSLCEVLHPSPIQHFLDLHRKKR